MRFLVHEQPYERLIAAGRFLYRQEGVLTGAEEKWRLTAAQEEYRLLRVDLDARAAASGDSYLYHLVLDGANRPVRLTFRFWGGDGRRVEGNAFVDGKELRVGWTVDGTRRERSADLAEPWTFWFPSTAALCFPARQAGPAGAERVVNGLFLDRSADFDLLQAPVTVERAAPVPVSVGRERRLARPVSVAWDATERLVWLDDDGFVLRMVRAATELEAVETQVIRHG